ncbi:MAG: flagellar export protein FliJ [Desulfuromonadaceae bacterium]|nr:flagellar export protein FliJ [Desulfuromonadaceae bacterium]MDD5104037.1 flagellar export protein FliJ [Desulfuromonadaceae bacterium]
MAGKRFELEQVLVYRQEMEKLRKQEFAAARRTLDHANQELQREEQLVELLTQEFQRCQSDVGCVDDLRMYSNFFARKREEIKQQKEQIDYLEITVSEKRTDLTEASKEKKVLESLKEKKAHEYKQEIAIKERNFLDEISIQKKVKPA